MLYSASVKSRFRRVLCIKQQGAADVIATINQRHFVVRDLNSNKQ